MSVCSGIGVAELAAPWVDWQYQSEIDPFAIAVLKYRFPGATNLGDMTKFREWPDATVDVLAGGTPCQSFSVAGLRQGMADPRGNLALVFLAIADRYRPEWVVWENVPGVLSSNGGRDFGAFLGGLGQLGYGFAYRVLDAQFCRTHGHPRAVPQRRRRVFVVGHLGDWRRAAAVLFDAESLRGNPPPRRTTGQGVATGLASHSGGSGWPDGGDERHSQLICADVASTLNAHFGKTQWLEDQHVNSGLPLFVAHSLRAEGFDASEDGTGRGVPLIAFNHQSGGDFRPQPNENCANALQRSQGQAVVWPLNTQIATRHEALGEGTGFGIGDDGDPAFTLQSAHSHAIATSYAVRRLTPTECERLQGLPDGFTAITYRGKPAKDGPRYKALGNAWALNAATCVFDGLRQLLNNGARRRHVSAWL